MKHFYLAALLFGFCDSIAGAEWQQQTSARRGSPDPAEAADRKAPSQWRQQTVSSNADFRGLCAVSATVAWVSGTNGTYARTSDAGETWSVGTVPGATKLDFRDVEAFGETTAYLLSAGPGEDSRVYKTVDAGKTWILQFKNQDREAFFDAI